MRPISLARSSSSDGSEASAFTPSGFRAVVPIAPPRITNFSCALAKSMATLGAAIGSLDVAIKVGPLSKGPIDATSVPSGLSSVGSPGLGRRVAPAVLMASVRAPFGYKYRFRQDDDEACPPDACAFGESQKPLRQVHKVRTDSAGLAAGKIRLHPSMQA